MNPDRPIVGSLLDIDFYKLPMIQMIFHKQRHAKVGRRQVARLGERRPWTGDVVVVDRANLPLVLFAVRKPRHGHRHHLQRVAIGVSGFEKDDVSRGVVEKT